MTIEETKDLSALEEIVLSGLSEHRKAAGQTTLGEAEKFGFELRENGKIIGGITGKIRWNWLYIQYLWVDTNAAGKGYGKDLVKQAEELARTRGCTGLHVDTFTYQAPDFYKSLGFSEFGRLENYPENEQRIYLQKRL